MLLVALLWDLVCTRADNGGQPAVFYDVFSDVIKHCTKLWRLKSWFMALNSRGWLLLITVNGWLYNNVCDNMENPYMLRATGYVWGYLFYTIYNTWYRKKRSPGLIITHRPAACIQLRFTGMRVHQSITSWGVWKFDNDIFAIKADKAGRQPFIYLKTLSIFF